MHLDDSLIPKSMQRSFAGFIFWLFCKLKSNYSNYKSIIFNTRYKKVIRRSNARKYSKSTFRGEFC